MNEIDVMLEKKAAELEKNGKKIAYRIRILNMVTKQERTIPVYAGNCLDQVVERYGKQIGLDKLSGTLWFYNLDSRNRSALCDQKLTFSEFGIGPTDTLGISNQRS